MPHCTEGKRMKKQFDFIGNRKKFFALSLVLIVVIALCAAIFGVEMDIQFRGGAMLTYSFSGDVDANTLAEDVMLSFGESASTLMGNDVATGRKTITISLAGNSTVQPETVSAFADILNEKYVDNDFEQLSLNIVNPTMGNEFFLKCIVAVVLASLLILIYISLRFKNIGGLSAGAMAVVALVHDLIIVFGVFVIAQIPLNSNFIAAMLVILGYSINDTVVVYDRVRENKKLYGKTMGVEQLVNLSINQSLKRSINTTISTVLALGTVCVVSGIYGLTSIFTFALPLIVGMISGVYSTIFIAGPLWVTWMKHKENSPKKSTKK